MQYLGRQQDEGDQFIDQYFEDEYEIEDFDLYEKELHTKLFNSNHVPVEGNEYYWLAVLYCRGLRKEFKGQSLELLSELSQKGGLAKLIGEDQAIEFEEAQLFFQKLLYSNGFTKYLTNRKSISDGDRDWDIGDIFSIQSEPGKYVHGRILLKVSDLLKGKKTHPSINGLIGAKNCYLVEMYSGVFEENIEQESYDIVLPGVLVYPDAFENGFYTRIGNKLVENDSIDFPEYLNFSASDKEYNNQIHFIKGEIVIICSDNPILRDSKTDPYQILLNGYMLDGITRYHSHEENLPQIFRSMHDLSEIDLRFNKASIRDQVYNAVGLNPDTKYFDIALIHGTKK